MKTATQSLGALGEEIACHLLEAGGYKILLKNYICPLGEIDLIAKESGCLIFVEVKTRRTLIYGLPEEAIHPAKRHQLVQCARYYVSRYGIHDVCCRFDVVSVQVPYKEKPSVRIIKNAFDLTGPC